MKENICDAVEEIILNEDYIFLLQEEFILSIEYDGNKDMKYIVNIINRELEKNEKIFRIKKFNRIIAIYCLNLDNEKLLNELFKYQYEKFLESNLMTLYFQIRDCRYVDDDKLEDYTLGYLFGKLWNLHFLEILGDKVKIENSYATKPLKLKGKKKSGLTRSFGYPNFINFIHLRNFLIENKEEVINILLKNKSSLSKFFMNSYSDNKKIETLDMSLKNKTNVLKLDIQNFYGSIYTHAIDWSIRGKEKAQASRKSEEFSALLDKYVQNMNNSETFGLIIGTDISRIIAELYISSIENQELKRLPEDIKYYRFVDDYKVFYDKHESKEKFMRQLESTFEKYRLQINEKKIIDFKKIDYLKEHFKLDGIYDNNIQLIKSYLEEGYTNGIASIIYNSIYKYINNEETSMFIIYMEIEKIFKEVQDYDKENSTEYLKDLKNTNFIDLLMEIFMQHKGLDKYFLEFLYNNYDKIDDKWSNILNEEIKKFYNENNIYVIQILSLMFVYRMKIGKDNTSIIIERGDSISATIVYSQIKVLGEEKIYKEVIESRIKTTINKGAFESDDFIFLVEYYSRNRNHISKNANDLINFSEIKEKSTNKEYKDFIKNNKGVHLIDYEKVKK